MSKFDNLFYYFFSVEYNVNLSITQTLNKNVRSKVISELKGKVLEKSPIIHLRRYIDL